MSDKNNASTWDEIGDFFGKVGSTWADIIVAKETSQPQVPASVGVTEPVTTESAKPAAPVTTVAPTIALDNKTLLIGGAAVMLIMVMMMTMSRGR